MLRRNSSRNSSRNSPGHRLGRSKSASSIKTLRANARGMSPPSSRPSRDFAAPPLVRKQSVRFAGPNARPRRPLAVRANQPSAQPPGRDEARLLGPATNPPSRGRLRKSKSMLTSRFQSTDRLRDWLGSDDKENGAERQGLRAANSMTVLPGHDGYRQSRLSNCTNEDNSPRRDVADRKPQDSMPRRTLKPQPSILSRRQYGSSAGFPKSLRNSSNGSGSGAPSSGFSAASTPASRRSTLRFTARKVSHSLGTRFRGLFSRSKSKSADDAMGGSLNLPDPVSSHSISHGHEYLSDPGEASLSRVTSHVPSLHVAESSQHLQSRQGSLDNLHVEQKVPLDDRSRVTSWTTSSVNTVMSPSPETEWERQRLSVIKENGMHVSSSRSKTPVGGLTSREHGLPSGCVVDSERIYSALLRRLEETKRLQQKGELTADLVPPRGISAEHSASRKRSPPTIRRVRPDDVFNDEQPEQTDGRITPARSTSYQPYPKPAAGDGKGLSPERRAKAEDQPQRSPDRRSAFFASPTCHLFRTASPYRRVLREKMRDAHEVDQTYDGDGRCLSVLSALSLPTRCPSTTGSENGAEQSDGASVYSCVTQPQGAGQDVDDYGSAVDDQQPGTVVAAHDRNVSSTSSVEWKLWLSANVSKMETPSTTMSADSYGDVSYKSPAFGHVREEAEIESPGEVLKPIAGTNARPAKQSTESPDTPCCRTRHDENSPPAADEVSFSKPRVIWQVVG
ncbi:hypothetical protein CDD80_3866 [Ophiocordyceps camponoti-rufipedis]|uniref:Uncharacterized protein n=1 Tax=Ophiocordyceps camponoti-rufipedis TaxID=2004952 RepID=A0A2C5Z147_9HYPO|nr:hypothetical protein CDD80_3866 [Ophiocordyceps camponoti-rufipedis]